MPSKISVSRLAFTTIDTAFSRLIETMFAQYDEVCRNLSKAGQDTYIGNGYFWFDGLGIGYFYEEF